MAQEDVKIECVGCRRKTNHEVVKSVEFTHHSEPHDIHVGEDFEIVRCRGCEALSFRHTSWCSEDLDRYTKQPELRETLYPSRTQGRNPLRAWGFLPGRVKDVYDEMLKAMNADAPMLAAVGLRAVVEAICLEEGCATGNLEKKIDALETKGALSGKQAQFLHVHRFMGNDAAHEMTAPSAEELNAAVDVVESVLQTLYELPEVTAELTARRDARRKKTKKASAKKALLKKATSKRTT